MSRSDSVPVPERLAARRGRPARFLARVFVPTSLDETFAFFAEAGNLQRLTPAWLDFRILTPAPVAMRAGLRLDYRLRVHGIPLRWQSLISVWAPPHRFVDVQVRGPYRWWHHEHRFEPCTGGTAVIDEVEYRAPCAWLSHPLLVRRDVERIFAYRSARLTALFGQPPPDAPSLPAVQPSAPSRTG